MSDEYRNALITALKEMKDLETVLCMIVWKKVKLQRLIDNLTKLVEKEQ